MPPDPDSSSNTGSLNTVVPICASGLNLFYATYQVFCWLYLKPELTVYHFKSYFGDLR